MTSCRLLMANCMYLQSVGGSFFVKLKSFRHCERPVALASSQAQATLTLAPKCQGVFCQDKETLARLVEAMKKELHIREPESESYTMLYKHIDEYAQALQGSS